MATTLLTGSGAAELPRRELTLVVDVDPSAAQGDFELRPGLPTVAPRPGMVVVDEVPGETTVALVPLGRPTFPSPAIAHLTISTPPEIAGFDGDRVVVSNIDLTGTGRRDLVTISRVGESYRFTRVDPARPVDLPPLAEAARVAARRALGADHLPHDEPVRVVIDTSASMLAPTRSGALHDVIEVLSGVAVLLSQNGRLVVDVDTQPERDVAAKDAAGAVAEVVNGAAVGSAFDVGSVAAHPGVTFVVTDGIPYGVEHLESLVSGTCHLVLLCDSLAAALLQGTTALPVAAVEVPEVGRLADSLTADPGRLLRVVQTLLSTHLAGGGA